MEDNIDFGKIISFTIEDKYKKEVETIPMKKEYCFDMEVKTMNRDLLTQLLQPKPCERCGNIPDFYLQNPTTLELWCNRCLNK